MHDKKFIIGAAIGIAAIIILLVLTMFLGGSDEQVVDEPQNPFADTGDVRDDISLVGIIPKGGSSTDLTLTPENRSNPAPDLRAVSNDPAIGGTIFNKNGVETIRYTDRGTGHVLETPADVMEEPVTISSDTITRIGESLWSTNGAVTLFRRYSKDATGLSTYLDSFVSGGYSSSSVDQKVDGRALPDTVIDAALSPDGEYVFFLNKTDEGTVGIVESVDMGMRRTVWKSTLTNLSVSWNAPSTIVIYNNPTSYGHGFVWLLNPNTEKATVLLAKQYALAALSDRTGDNILYSLQETKEGVTSLRVHTIGSTEEPVSLPRASIVEKCAWGTVGKTTIYCAVPENLGDRNYLENWYMGLKESRDVIYQFDFKLGSIKKVLDPKEHANIPFDITDLVVSPNEDFVLFRTHQNSILWSARIPEDIQPQAMSDMEEDTDVE